MGQQPEMSSFFTVGLPGVDAARYLSSVSGRAVPQAVELIHLQRARPFHRDGWIYEEKYDGWRVVAFKDGARVRLGSRTGRDNAARSPRLPRRSLGSGCRR